jgi:acylphosphatase
MERPEAEVVRRRVVVHGRVQGVGFRESTRRRAETAGVRGWVRNRPDGTVEAVFEGRPEDVDLLVAYCRVGPPEARVVRVEVVAEAPSGVAGFEIRRG